MKFRTNQMWGSYTKAIHACYVCYVLFVELPVINQFFIINFGGKVCMSGYFGRNC